MLHSLESSNSYTENKEYVLLAQQVEKAKKNRTKAVKSDYEQLKEDCAKLLEK